MTPEIWYELEISGGSSRGRSVDLGNRKTSAYGNVKVAIWILLGAMMMVVVCHSCLRDAGGGLGKKATIGVGRKSRSDRDKTVFS